MKATRPPVVWALCLAGALLAGCPRSQPGETAAPTHVELLVETGGDSLTVLRAETASPDPGREEAYSPGAGRPAGLLADITAADGSVLATHAFAPPTAYGESLDPSGPGLEGGRPVPEREQRLLYVPLSPGATGITLRDSRHPNAAPLRVALADVAPARETQPSPPTGGQLQGHDMYHVTGKPQDQYDIVILGDGFGLGEVAEYEKVAKAFSDYFLSYAPFDSLRDHINIYIVSALSDDSGISLCSDEDMHETYYGVQGCFQLTPGDTTYQAYCGVHEPQRILKAAATVLPNANTDLYFVIANCTEYQGGSAFPPMKTAYATVGSCRQKFLDIAVHECAHVIGKLADEYIGGAPDDGSQQPNLVRQADVDAGNVWWKRLARPDELTASGDFRYTSVCGDAFWPVLTCKEGDPCPGLCDADCIPGIPCTPCDPKLTNGDGYPRDADKLGLFWGCQFIDSTKVNDPPKYDCGLMDERGCGYYRGGTRCKMRFEDYPFCRVCADVLTRAVLGS